MNTLRNQVTLIGNLGNEFELKTFGMDKKLAKASLATNEYYKNREGEKVQETQWHNLVVWGKLAERISSMSAKGDQIMVQGKLIYRNYEDGDGKKQYVTEIVVSEFVKLTKTTVPLEAQETT